MGLQDKFEDYKQKQEAKQFFNENNTEYLNASELIKAGLVGILVAIAGGFIIQKIGEITGYNFSIAFILVGLAISSVMKKMAGNSGMRLAIVAAIVYLVGMILGTLIYVMMLFPGISFSIDLLKICIESLFIDDIFSTIMICIGAFTAFSDANR